MTDENQEVEQITRPPTNTSTKPCKDKDPKKVAAGRKLAEHNKRAKEALKREMKREEEQSTEEGSSNAWIPEISFTAALSLAGIGLTCYDLFMRFRANAAKGLQNHASKTITHDEVQNDHTESKNTLVNPNHKFGMD